MSIAYNTNDSYPPATREQEPTIHRKPAPNHPCYHCYSDMWVWDKHMKSYRCSFCYPEGEYLPVREMMKRAEENRARLLAQNAASGSPAREQEQGQEQETAPAHSRDNHPLKVRNGVLTDTALYYSSAGKLVKQAIAGVPAHIGIIFQMCLDYQLETIWVLADTQVSAGATQSAINAAREQWIVSDVKTVEIAASVERVTFAGAWKKEQQRREQETGRKVFIAYAEHAKDWKLDRVENPVTLLAAISYIEDALETALRAYVPVRFSPGNVGKEVMYLVNNKREREQWITHIDINRYAPVVSEKVGQRLWKRPLTDEEQARAFIVAYDKNSMYPASCTGVVLGAGLPAHVSNPTFDAKRERPLPGVWHCTIRGSSPFNGKDLPHPTEGKISGWFWSYTVKLLYEVGYEVAIDEAYIWNEGHTILRPFAEKLWDAREQVQTNTARYAHEQARNIAQGAIKQVMNISLGWLDMGKNRVRDEDETPWYHRPDWYQLLKDNAHYRMFWTIRARLKEGYSPVGIYEDCLYYASNEANHLLAIPGMMKKAGLGGFKRKYPVDVSMEIARPLFNNPAMHMGRINTTFNHLESEN